MGVRSVANRVGRGRDLRRITATWALASVLGTLASGCGAEPTDKTPAGAVTLFLAAMSDTEWNDGQRATAYHLLAPEARAVLTAKAARASGLAGRALHPWEMIVEGRFRMRFSPDPARTKERVSGRTGVVTLSSGKAGESAEVPVVREGDRWRIALSLDGSTEDAP